MYDLSRRSRRKLERAKRSQNADELAEVKEEVLEGECERWSRSPQGRYGLLTEEECQAKAPELVQRAWGKLKEVTQEQFQDVMDDYEGQQGGPPQFDSKGEVNRDVGGRTLTRWREFRRGFQQIGSESIQVGGKYICRRKRSSTACVVISIMKTLVHELMGHWNQIGQRVGVDPNLSPEDRQSVRKAKAERRADRITEREWRRIRRTTAFEQCEEEWEDDFEERKEQIKKQICKAIETFLC